MPNSKIVIEFRLPTTSYIRISDAIQAVNDVVKEHRGNELFTTVSGPYTEESENVSNSSSSRSPELGRSDTNSSPAPSSGGDQPVKRRPGRPRKTEAGPTPESQQASSTGAGQEAAGRSGAEGSIEHVARGPDQSFVQGSGEGQGGDGSDGGSGVDQRGAGAPDRLESEPRAAIFSHPPRPPSAAMDWLQPDPEAVKATITAADTDWDNEETGEEPDLDEWADSPVPAQDFDELWHAKAPGDEWPASLMPAGLSPQTMDRTQLNTLLGDHFRTCGDKTRETTLAVVEKATGQRSVGQVSPDQYWTLARCIIKDIKRYEHGLLKPKS